jgi:hypothetical protein
LNYMAVLLLLVIPLIPVGGYRFNIFLNHPLTPKTIGKPSSRLVWSLPQNWDLYYFATMYYSACLSSPRQIKSRSKSKLFTSLSCLCLLAHTVLIRKLVFSKCLLST